MGLQQLPFPENNFADPNRVDIYMTDGVHNIFLLYFHHFVVSPRGDGPLPEVGAIPGQPVKETKQALCILLDTKI